MATPYIGEIRMFAGSFAPVGWAFCNGQLLAVSEYDALFSLFGTIYGGDGRTTFGLPDLRGRVPIHDGGSQGPAVSPRPLGSSGGQENVTLTVNQLPAHSHPMQATSSPANATSPANKVPAAAQGDVYSTDLSTTPMSAAAVTSVGGGQPHNNLQPYLCVNFIVALFGVFPPRP